jgi:plasmid stabilization system protein ParE
VSRTLRIVQRAQTDVDDIFNWLVPRSILGAVSWYVAFGLAAEQIRATPESYPEALEAHALRRDLRQALFKTRRGRFYRIVFQFNDSEVIILRLRGPRQSRLRRGDVPND